MIGPKGKISKARRDKRRAQTWKIALPGLVACRNCGELTKPHQVCKACGTYKRREIVKVAE
jgi:large subunit ribosomal protein L32